MQQLTGSRLPLAIFLALSCMVGMPASAQEPIEEEEDFFEFDDESTAVPPIADPLESFNRASFAFNDKLYRGVLKPIARGLRVLPEPVRVSMSNFFTNLGTPISAASALLQGDPKNAASELGRFVINSTVGIVGLLDPATDMGLRQDEEDLGQTLARYGVGHGMYLVVPFFGSTSARDLVGSIGTAGWNPLYQELDPGEIAAINLASAEVALSLDKDTYEAFYDSSLDPYIFFRSAWTQNRAGAVEK